MINYYGICPCCLSHKNLKSRYPRSQIECDSCSTGWVELFTSQMLRDIRELELRYDISIHYKKIEGLVFSLEDLIEVDSIRSESLKLTSRSVQILYDCIEKILKNHDLQEYSSHIHVCGEDKKTARVEYLCRTSGPILDSLTEGLIRNEFNAKQPNVHLILSSEPKLEKFKII